MSSHPIATTPQGEKSQNANVTFEQIVETFDAKRVGKDWIASCPLPKNHKTGDVENPSLVISQTKGKPLVHCRTGCDQDSVFQAVIEKVKTGAVSTDEAKNEFEGTQAQVDKLCAALVNSEGQKYLESRGISMSIAAELQFGFSRGSFGEGEEGQPALVTPHYVGGKLVGLKARGIEKKSFIQLPGSSIQGLYGADTMSVWHEDILIFEGDLDVALARSHGFNAAGIISADSKLSNADLTLLKQFRRIFLIGDQDRAGKAAMDRLTAQLPPEQVIRVKLPGFKDIGEIYTKDPVNFQKILTRYLRTAQASREHFEPEDLLTESEIKAGQEDITPYIVDKILPANSITMFFGEEKSGKSMLVVYLLKCIANGRKVFDVLPVEQRPVLYIDMENSNSDMSGMVEFFKTIGPAEIRYLNRVTGCPPLDSEGLIRFCEKYKPIIAIDSLTKISKGVDMFHPGEMSELFDKLLNLCAAGATVILIHHSTKADVEKYADSHQIGANVSRAFAVISLDRPALQRVRLEAKLFRGAEPASFNLIAFPVIANEGKFGLADPGAMRTDADSVVDWILENQGRFPNGCTQEAVKKNMKGWRDSRKTKAIREALQSGRLSKREGGVLVVSGQPKKPVPRSGHDSSRENSFPKSGTNGHDFEDKPQKSLIN